MFERLTEGISNAVRGVGGKSADAAREEFVGTVRDRLLDSDVHPDVTSRLVDRLQRRLSAPDQDTSAAPSARFMDGLREEMIGILGGQPEPLRLKSSGTSAIMLVGLQGTGKTTTVGKLARHLAGQGKSVMLVPLDVRRPAAIDQLRILGESLDVPVWGTTAQSKPVKEARAAIKAADKQGIDVVLLDTAGRLAIDRELMDEIATLRDKVRPQEILYVLDAMAGQSAVQTAEAFAETVKPTGIVLTKVDADPRGGAVLSVGARTGIPVKYMGVGEKHADLEPFDPQRIVNRLLDMGDIESLTEKFDAAVSAEEAEALGERMMSGKFSLEDFGRQLELMGSMGPLENILGMIPGGKGLAKQMRDLSLAETEIKRTLAIIRSMTPKERRNPRLIGNSHKKRISAGSGTSVGDVNRVLKRYKTMQKLMKQLSKSPMRALQGLMGGGGGFPGMGGGGGLPPGFPGGR